MAGKGKKCAVKRKSSAKKGRQPVRKMKTAKKLKKPGGAKGPY